MDVEEKLVEYILNTHFGDLPEQAIEIGKTLILTVLGTTIAGSSSEGCEAVLEQVHEWGGRDSRNTKHLRDRGIQLVLPGQENQEHESERTGKHGGYRSVESVKRPGGFPANQGASRP